jgi:hypothetical protein
MSNRHFNINDIKRTDPSKLHGLMQAMYIAESLCTKESVDEIVDRFGGDVQLVDMWLSFLKHNHWLYYEKEKRCWLMTQRGEQYSRDLAQDYIAIYQTQTSAI